MMHVPKNLSIGVMNGLLTAACVPSVMKLQRVLVVVTQVSGSGTMKARIIILCTYSY
jgi:hypothetical protein